MRTNIWTTLGGPMLDPRPIAAVDQSVAEAVSAGLPYVIAGPNNQRVFLDQIVMYEATE
jgi:hypothetical protein